MHGQMWTDTEATPNSGTAPVTCFDEKERHVCHSTLPVAYRFLVRSATNKKENQMKVLMTMIAVTLSAFTARASEPVPYIAMPIDKGYAVDAQGKRQPNVLCKRDIIWARGPRYPFSPPSNDPASWPRNLWGDGLYRLYIDLKTGRVTQIGIIKSAGSTLDGASIRAFSRWVFTPGKWSAMIIPTTVRIIWVPVLIQEREA
jgi:hypothetical protein